MIISWHRHKLAKLSHPLMSPFPQYIAWLTFIVKLAGYPASLGLRPSALPSPLPSPPLGHIHNWEEFILLGTGQCRHNVITIVKYVIKLTLNLKDYNVFPARNACIGKDRWRSGYSSSLWHEPCRGVNINHYCWRPATFFHWQGFFFCEWLGNDFKLTFSALLLCGVQ